MFQPNQRPEPGRDRPRSYHSGGEPPTRTLGVVIGCIVGAVLLFGLAICGGAGGLVMLGLHLYTDEVCTYLGDQPAVNEALGDVVSCELDWTDSGRIQDPDTMVMQLEGVRRSGRVYVQSTSTGPGGAEEYQGILLVVGGERILVEGHEPPTE